MASFLFVLLCLGVFEHGTTVPITIETEGHHVYETEDNTLDSTNASVRSPQGNVIVDAIVPDFQTDGNNGNIGTEGSDLLPVDIHDNVTDKPIIEKPDVKFIVGKRVHGFDPNVRYFNETEENNLNNTYDIHLNENSKDSHHNGGEEIINVNGNTNESVLYRPATKDENIDHVGHVVYNEGRHVLSGGHSETHENIMPERHESVVENITERSHIETEFTESVRNLPDMVPDHENHVEKNEELFTQSTEAILKISTSTPVNENGEEVDKHESEIEQTTESIRQLPESNEKEPILKPDEKEQEPKIVSESPSIREPHHVITTEGSRRFNNEVTEEGNIIIDPDMHVDHKEEEKTTTEAVRQFPEITEGEVRLPHDGPAVHPPIRTTTKRWSHFSEKVQDLGQTTELLPEATEGDMLLPNDTSEIITTTSNLPSSTAEVEKSSIRLTTIGVDIEETTKSGDVFPDITESQPGHENKEQTTIGGLSQVTESSVLKPEIDGNTTKSTGEKDEVHKEHTTITNRQGLTNVFINTYTTKHDHYNTEESETQHETIKNTFEVSNAPHTEFSVDSSRLTVTTQSNSKTDAEIFPSIMPTQTVITNKIDGIGNSQEGHLRQSSIIPSFIDNHLTSSSVISKSKYTYISSQRDELQTSFIDNHLTSSSVISKSKYTYISSQRDELQTSFIIPSTTALTDHSFNQIGGMTSAMRNSDSKSENTLFKLESSSVEKCLNCLHSSSTVSTQVLSTTLLKKQLTESSEHIFERGSSKSFEIYSSQLDHEPYSSLSGQDSSHSSSEFRNEIKTTFPSSEFSLYVTTSFDLKNRKSAVLITSSVDRITPTHSYHTESSRVRESTAATKKMDSIGTMKPPPRTIPATHSPKDTPPTSTHVYINIDMKMTLYEFCKLKPMFISQLADIMGSAEKFEVSQEQIMLQYPVQDDCDKPPQPWDNEEVIIQMYVLDTTGKIDISLTQDMAKHIKPGLQSSKSEFSQKLESVKIVTPPNIAETKPPAVMSNENNPETQRIETGITIAISIAAVGGFCCISLIILQIIIHKRSGKRMHPYFLGGGSTTSRLSMRSMDSIALGVVPKSRPHSGFWNHGLELDEQDLKDPSHPLVYSALTDFSMDTDAIYQEFQLIPNETPRLSCVPVGAEDKNRFANVIPHPHSRVKLKKIAGEDFSEYINANYVTGYKDDLRGYIATQAPMSHTAADFWRMVWEQQSRVILMLTEMDERGQPRCLPYWPEKTGIENRLSYGDYYIVLKKKEVHQEYIVSILEIKDIEKNLVREIHHFWYTCWPSNETPEPISVVKFVLDTRPYYEDSGAPVIVHCSPGTGRTGSLIAIDICMRSYEDKRSVNILNTVYKMRKERAGAVQTRDQYNLIYKAVNEYAVVMSTPTSISTTSSVVTLQNML